MDHGVRVSLKFPPDFVIHVKQFYYVLYEYTKLYDGHKDSDHNPNLLTPQMTVTV